MTRAIGAVAVCAVLSATPALAQSNTNKGSTPQGKPFQQIQTQIGSLNTQVSALQQQVTTLQQEMTALQTQVTTLQTNLQQQIAALYGTVSQLESRVTTVEQGMAAITARVTANEGAISALQSTVAAIEAQIDAVKAQITAHQTTLASLQAQISGQQGDIAVLQAQSANLTSHIANLQVTLSQLQGTVGMHTAQISNLQSQNSQTTQFLNNMANMNCSVGTAIQDIGANGVITCTPAGAGSLQAYAAYTYGVAGANSGWNVNASCQAGYTVSGGGHAGMSAWEWTPTISGLSAHTYTKDWETIWYWDSYYGWQYYYIYDDVTAVNWTSSGHYRNALSISNSYPSYGSYHVSGENRGSYSVGLYAIANCMKTQ